MIFYIFGFHSFFKLTRTHKTPIKIIILLPRLLNICVNLFIIYELSEKYQTYSVLLIYARSAIVFLIIMNVVAVGENVWNSQTAHQILQTMSITIDSLKTSLNIKYPYHSLIKSVYWKMIIQFLVIVVGWILKCSVESVNVTVWKKGALWAISNVIKCVNLFHLIFYIDFMTFTLQSLNHRVVMLMITKISWCNNQSTELLHAIRQMKFIHFKLCHVSRCINSLFGWFLVIYVIETILSTTYDVFLAFVLDNETEVQPINSIRKY